MEETEVKKESGMGCAGWKHGFK